MTLPGRSTASHGGKETALLLGNYLPSLAAARALSAAGYRVIAGDGGEYSNVGHSRYCAEVWRHPPIANAEAFFGALTAFLARSPEITTIVPLQERYVAFLSHAKDRLPASVTLAAPSAQVVATCLDKVSMYAIAGEVGVPYRRIIRVADVSALAEATEELGYPCVIRPADQLIQLDGDAKALICPDRATVERFVAGWTGQHGSLLVQRYVHGPRHNIYFIADHGRILALLETQVLRTDRPDGTGVAVEEVFGTPDARLVGYCQAMLERLDYTGIGGAQFIVPVTGEPNFIEINPRHDASAAGVEGCGLDLTLAAVELASGAGRWRPDPDFQYPLGRRMAWTSRDLYGLGLAVSRREVGLASTLRWLAGALVAAVRADVHLVWDRKDPLPALALYAHLVSLGPWRRSRRQQREHERRSTQIHAEPSMGEADVLPGSAARRQGVAATPGIVLVLGGRHPALAAARALSAAGYRVIAGDGGEYSTLRHSRHCQEVWPHPSPRDAESFLAALVEFLEQRPDITTILPLQDRYVALLSARRDQLPDSVVLAAVDGPVAEICLDKSRMYAIAADLGVPYAPILQARDRSELILAAEGVGYPCVVRPAVFDGPLPLQLKAVVCADRAALEGLLADGPDAFGFMLVQRYVTGVRRNVWFAARDGRLLVSLHADTLRTDRLDGTGILVAGVTVKPDPRLRGYLEALVGQLGYTGVGGAQFIVPVEGEPSFLEINPRPAGTGIPLQRHCGLDLTLAAVELASGTGRWRPDPDFQYPLGRRMAWSSRDLYGLGLAVSRREVGVASMLRWLAGALVAAVRADVHLAWDRKDPLPAFALYAHLVSLGPKHRSQRRA